MNAIMTSASAAHQLQRYDAIRRRNAEQAYHRQAEYNGRNQKMLDDLEALLTGKKELDGGQESRDLKKLDVQRETISVQEPTMADRQQVAAASAKFMETETRIALQKSEQSNLDAEVKRLQAEKLNAASMNLPTDHEREQLVEQKRFAKAISAYLFQVEAKRNGFTADWSGFNKTA